MERAEAIRTLFLHDRDDYSLDEAARLVGWSSDGGGDCLIRTEERRPRRARLLAALGHRRHHHLVGRSYRKSGWAATPTLSRLWRA